MQINSCFRSSPSWRVRIALALKDLDAIYVPVHLVRGEQRGAALASAMPTQLVPALVDGGDAVHQSLAIIKYLDEAHPTPPLLPAAAHETPCVNPPCLEQGLSAPGCSVARHPQRASAQGSPVGDPYRICRARGRS